MEGYIGEIRLFAPAFVPLNWALCNGSLLQIQSNSTLFTILGIAYGGNGTTNFALPNLAAQTPVGSGQGTGLTNWSLGEQRGAFSHTLLATELPAHFHSGTITGTPVLRANSGDATLAVPVAGASIATPGRMASGTFINTLGFSTAAPNTFLNTASAVAANVPLSPLSPAGGSQPHNNMQPSLGLTFIICLSGSYPPRP